MIEEISISPVDKRLLGGFMGTLGNLWLKHFGTREFFEVEKGGSLWSRGGLFGIDYSPYRSAFAEVALSLTYLHHLGKIPANPELFESNGRFNHDLSTQVLEDLLFRRRLLNGINVLVIGGPEGRIFAEMGATVVGIDPYIDRAPKIDLPNLEEIPDYFVDARSVPPTHDGFDLTLSSRLFDRGSGLARFRESREVYQQTLRGLLEVTRNGGLSIHDGDSVPVATKANTDLCRLLEVASPFGNDKPGSSSLAYVLQRI